MFSELNNSELTFPKVILKVVEVVYVELSNYLADGFEPLRLAFDRAKIKDPRLIWRQHNLYRVQVASSVGVHLGLCFLNESTGQAVHNSLVVVSLIPKAH